VPFQPGQSGNPSGRPKQDVKLRDLARAHTSDAIATLVEVMKDVKAPPSARVSAANSVLDRGFGKPVQPVDGDGEGGPVGLVFSWQPPT
jgi:hypothetical protein